MFTQHDDLTRKHKPSFSVYGESIDWMMYRLDKLPPAKTLGWLGGNILHYINNVPFGQALTFYVPTNFVVSGLPHVVGTCIASVRSIVTFLTSVLTAYCIRSIQGTICSLSLSNCDMSSFVIGSKIWVETRLTCGSINGTTNPTLWKWFVSTFWHNSMILDWPASMWLMVEPRAVPILICRVPSYLCT